MEEDFPSLENGKKLDNSPRDLGISRADLWAFAGLVALDNVQGNSYALCSENANNLTCGDTSTPCYSPFPKEALNLFKTGRVDCIPDPSKGNKKGYLVSGPNKIEAEPDRNGNGAETTKYFKEKFDMIPREALAIMGAHTVGGFSTFQEHVDYAWVRALPTETNKRNQLFNNEYYKTLAGRSAKTKTAHCVGTMNDTAPEHQWLIRALLFDYMWPQYDETGKDLDWINKPRRLLWNHLVTRAPVCDEEEEDKLGTGGKFWNVVDCDEKSKCKEAGFDNFYDYCCDLKRNGCGMRGDCDEDCTRSVQDRIRHLSSDVGFYLKWETNEKGYPTGDHCEAFRMDTNEKSIGSKDWLWNYGFDTNEKPQFAKDKSGKISKNRKRVLDGGEAGRIANCAKQV